MLTIVLRKYVAVVAADGLDVLAAICGDATLDWDADLFDVVSGRTASEVKTGLRRLTQ